MIINKTFKVSEARSKLFDIFKMVSQGQNVIIINSDTNQKFQVIPFEEKPREDKVAIAKKMGKIGLKEKSWQEMKAIIETRLDLNLD